jgi:acyl dehydratase
MSRLFATAFYETRPMYFSAVDANKAGYTDLPVHPLLVLGMAMSLGMEADSEQAIAHLGFRDLYFHRPIYPDMVLRTITQVLDVAVKGDEHPGVVELQSAVVGDDGLPVIHYRRSMLVRRRPSGLDASPVDAGQAEFPDLDIRSWFPPAMESWPAAPGYRKGDVILHQSRRTVTDEHVTWASWLGSTHPAHFDQLYPGNEEPSSAGPEVHSSLVLAWAAGLAGRDTVQHAVAEIGYDDGHEAAPLVTGDTISVLSRLLDRTAVEEGTEMTFRLVAIKNQTADDAWDQWGAAIFDPELSKEPKERVENKVLEINRRVLFAPTPLEVVPGQSPPLRIVRS